MSRKIAVLVGSLRKESFSRKVARAIEAEAPDSLAFEHVDLSSVGHYNQDLDTENPPPEWAKLRAAIKSADAVLFVTPEYNRSVPGFLKNAIDIASRPYGKSAFAGKPAAVVSNSPGAIGGFGANHHLRQTLHFLDMPALQQPEMYLGGVGDWFDADGKLVKDDKRQYLAKFGKAFADWIELNLAK
ncbi:MAG: ACP phosphodiesterase [Alphaproteobacteria bacterium]|nr:ACP phosphodiesterase [Alphaproteobacteria bacterium]